MIRSVPMTKHRFVLVFFLPVLLSLNGCLEITTTTEVKTDGSFVRTITFTGDSAAVYGGRFPVELDPTWTRTIERADDKKYTLTAQRLFGSVEEMNAVVAGVFGKTLQYRISCEKSFDWFFTKYRYEETTLPFRQFNTIPLTRYLSEQEIDWLKSKVLGGNANTELATHEDTLTLEHLSTRAEEWELRNRFEGVFSAFVAGAASINDPQLLPAVVESMKDTLFVRSKDAINEGKIDTLVVIFGKTLRSRAVNRAWLASKATLDEFKQKLEFENSTGSHKYVTNVIMPGLLTASNTTKIAGTTLTWQEYNDLARFFGYTMWAESRLVNWWAVGVAVVIVVALTVVLVLSVVRHRATAPANLTH